MELPPPWKPPYSLKTADDAELVAAMLRRRPDLTPETAEFIDRFEQFARTQRIMRPAIMWRLPPRIDLELLSLPVEMRSRRPRHAGEPPQPETGTTRRLPPTLNGEEPLRPLRLLYERYQKYALLDPSLGYADVLERFLSRQLADVELTAPVAEAGEPHPKAHTASLTRAVATRRRFFDYLSRAFTTYIETKSPETEEALLSICYTLLAYDSRGNGLDDKLLGSLAKRPSEYTRQDLETVRERHCRRLERLRESLTAPIVAQQLEKAKRATARTRLKTQVRTNLIRHLNDAITAPELDRIETLVERALKLYREHAPSADVVRVQGITQNALRKLRFIPSFFEKHFCKPEIEDLVELFRSQPQRDGGALERRSGNSTAATLTEALHLTLYPSKDYFEFLKAIPSADCTWWTNLAGGHLLSPRFFNLRIFRGRYWMGNVYLLDYSATSDTIVVDRVQIQEPETFFPLQFFAGFVERLLEVLLGAAPGARILAAESISNAPLVQQSYFLGTRGFARTSFTFKEEDKRFECAQGQPLVVLRPPGHTNAPQS